MEIDTIKENSNRLTEAELVDYWKISKNTLRKWRSLGTGPIYVKIGGRVLYRREDIAKYEAENLYRCSSERIQNKQGGDDE